MNFALPVNIGCISLDNSTSSNQLSIHLKDFEKSGKFKVLSLTFSYDEVLSQKMKPDILVLTEREYSERIFSVVSHFRSISQHALRPILILCESKKILSEAQRAKALGLEIFSDHADLIQSIRTLCINVLNDESNSAPYPMLLQRLFDTHNFVELKQMISRMSDHLPDSIQACVLEALLLLIEENTVKAEQLLRKAVSRQPGSLAIRYLLARVLARKGKYDEAHLLLEQHSHFPFLETISLMGMARIALEKSEHLRAENYFQTCQQRDNSNAEAELGLGKIAFARGDLSTASEHFVRAGHYDELASYFNQMAIALVNQQRYDDALSIYQNALKVLPSRDKHHFIHYNIGLAHKKRGALLEAANSFASSLQLSPGFEKALQSLKEVLKLAAHAGGDQRAFEQHRSILKARDKEN